MHTYWARLLLLSTPKDYLFTQKQLPVDLHEYYVCTIVAQLHDGCRNIIQLHIFV